MEALANTVVEFYVPEHVPQALVRPFDFINAPGMSQDPFDALERFRGDGSVFWNPVNPFFRGAWVLSQADDLRYVLSNPKLFSNQGEAEHSRSENAEVELIPLEYDPPHHTKIRRFLNPILSPVAVRKLYDGITARTIELVEEIRPAGSCEFIGDFAVPFPVSVFLQLMGLPESDAGKAVAWKTAILHSHLVGADVADAASNDLIAYLEVHVAERRRHPGDDFISYVANTQIDGEQLSDFEVRGILYLMLLAGLDTVTATLGWFFHHLAVNPEQQQRLRENPELVPKAVEEMLRLYSITIAHRKCTADVEVAGVRMKEGDWISIVSPLGSRDPKEFAEPGRLDLGRESTRHFGFGFGPHICAGAHLARFELQIALREWLARVPMWRLKPGVDVKAYAGTSFGLHALDLEWDV